jgi:hypothetical protein
MTEPTWMLEELFWATAALPSLCASPCHPPMLAIARESLQIELVLTKLCCLGPRSFPSAHEVKVWNNPLNRMLVLHSQLQSHPDLEQTVLCHLIPVCLWARYFISKNTSFLWNVGQNIYWQHCLWHLKGIYTLLSVITEKQISLFTAETS